MDEYMKVISAGYAVCEEFAHSDDGIEIKHYEPGTGIFVQVAEKYADDLVERLQATSVYWKVMAKGLFTSEDEDGKETEVYLLKAVLNFIHFPPEGFKEAA